MTQIDAIQRREGKRSKTHKERETEREKEEERKREKGKKIEIEIERESEPNDLALTKYCPCDIYTSTILHTNKRRNFMEKE